MFLNCEISYDNGFAEFPESRYAGDYKDRSYSEKLEYDRIQIHQAIYTLEYLFTLDLSNEINSRLFQRVMKTLQDHHKSYSFKIFNTENSCLPFDNSAEKIPLAILEKIYQHYFNLSQVNKTKILPKQIISMMNEYIQRLKDLASEPKLTRRLSC